MRYPKLMRLLLPFGIAASGMMLLAGTASAESADVTAANIPVATGVSVATDTTAEVTDKPEEIELTGEWLDTVDGRIYSYADGSYAVEAQTIDGIAYLFDSNGVQQTGWQKIGGVWHYYNPESYEAAIGTQEIDGTVYLFDFTGAEKIGWRTVNGVRQYYNPETGKMESGWITYAGNRYYADKDTGKQTGEYTQDGIRYWLDSEYGNQGLGFVTFPDQTVSYYDANGTAINGWMTLKDTGNRYYFDDAYVMQTGWKTIGQETYHFTADGVLHTLWQTIDGKRYYFTEAGAMQKGWQTLNQLQYYFNESGVLQTGFQTIGGSQYYFAGSGAMQTGWQTISGNKYYFTAKGVMLTGMQTIDGKKYRFLNNGVLKQVKICLDAGHYGKYNRSPVNGTCYESDMSWKLHLYLKAALEEYGIEVVTTRPTQAGDLGLTARGNLAKGCDLFLSLHSNATGNTAIDAPLACCCVSGAANALGQQLANTVHNVMGTSQGGTIWNRVGEAGDYYGVLRGAAAVGVPGILLEHSYHTNLSATNWLLNNANLQRMATAEAAVLAAYFGMQ